ncbi:hypothetical protein [Hungatella hathewayi]|uniref:hypothetical protein n=1 Tax=Hungatella hathewayi TaxID=154046 RepID=UPI003568B294
MDRVIQQGIVQIISPMCEPLFSEWSYGFRPDRTCKRAIRQLLVYLNEGYGRIMDTEKTWVKSQHDKNAYHKTAKAEISWLWIL